jgi:hypothetical protein
MSSKGLGEACFAHQRTTLNGSGQFRQIRRYFSSMFGGGIRGLAALGSKGEKPEDSMEYIAKRMGESLQEPAGPLYGKDVLEEEHVSFIPQVPLHDMDGRRNKRVLMLCTGGTLTMARDPAQGGALAPVEGALSNFMKEMNELRAENMPDGETLKVIHHTIIAWAFLL